jgi:hypothetical protein
MLGFLKATSSAAVGILLLTASVGGFARAEEAPPERLTIGYEGEGKVYASPEACLAFVKEEAAGWSQAQLEEAVQKVCAARKRHVEAYKALQNNYRTLMRLAAKGCSPFPHRSCCESQNYGEGLYRSQVRPHQRRP